MISRVDIGNEMVDEMVNHEMMDDGRWW